MKLISVIVAVLLSFFLLGASCLTDEDEERENTATLLTWCQFYASDVVYVDVSWGPFSGHYYKATWMAYDETTVHWKGSSPLQVTVEAWRETKSSEGDYFKRTVYLRDGEQDFLVIMLHEWQ
jgi:hypothetical protein